MKMHTSVGHVVWPTIPNKVYQNTNTGVLSVRFLVEDLTVDARYAAAKTQDDGQPEDTLLWCTDFPTPRAAHEYLSHPDRNIIRNVLLGMIDWSGMRDVPNGREYWHATWADLNENAMELVNECREHSLVGCRFMLTTALNQKAATVDGLFAEAKRLQLPTRNIPATQKPETCSECHAAKPLMGARREGWLRVSAGHWKCPQHALPAAAIVSTITPVEHT